MSLNTKQKEARFADPTYGFTFVYPHDWIVEAGAAVLLTPKSAGGRQGCEITVDRLTAAEFGDLYGPFGNAKNPRELAKTYAARVRHEARVGRVVDLAISSPRPRKCGLMEGYQVVLSYNNRARKVSALQEYSRAAFQQKRVVFAADRDFIYRLEYHCQGPAHLVDKYETAFRAVLKSFRAQE